MSTALPQTDPATGVPTRQNLSQRASSNWMWLILLALVSSLCTAQAQQADDLYFKVFNLVQDADSLEAKGETAAALAKFREAEKVLKEIKTEFPEWNQEVVAFRTKYVAQKIATLSQPAAAPPSTNASPAGATPAAGTSQASSEQIKLLEPGAEPRQALRLHPKVGDKQTLVMSVENATDIGAAGGGQSVKSPVMKFVVDFTVTDVAENGDIKYALKVQEAGVGEAPGVQPQVLEAFKPIIAATKGASGTGTTSPTGMGKQGDLKLPEGSAAGAAGPFAQVTDQLKDFFANRGTPLPEEAVGPGARWEVKSPLKTQGMTISQTATYELKSVEGSRVTIGTKISQTAAGQKTPQGEIRQLTGSGTGEVIQDLAKLLPASVTVDFRAEMKMRAGQNDLTIKNQTKVRMKANDAGAGAGS